jgi:hypothetical protein
MKQNFFQLQDLILSIFKIVLLLKIIISSQKNNESKVTIYKTKITKYLPLIVSQHVDHRTMRVRASEKKLLSLSIPLFKNILSLFF